MSDGFGDQFGGSEYRKFKRSRVREMILNYSSLPFAEQKYLIQTDFFNWKGSNAQTDDVLIIGIKI